MSRRDRISRRTFIGLGIFATAAAPTLLSTLSASASGIVPPGDGIPRQRVPPGSITPPGDGRPSGPSLQKLEEATIVQLQSAMASGDLSSVELVMFYQRRIAQYDQSGPKVNTIMQLNPDAISIATALDAERRKTGARGPLHGIPILLKDNVDTLDKMQATAGSLALLTSMAKADASIAAQLRQAGAVLLGKTTLSEWANFRSSFSSSGWSGRGGQCNNPYSLDRNPSGSSSGSAAATSANFTAVSIGTETDGSIISPANNSGVVGIKPTVGLTSRTGVIPISHNQDTVGPHGRTVADAAAVLGAITGFDPSDGMMMRAGRTAYTDYTQFLDPHGLEGVRIGVARKGLTGYNEKTDAVFETALQALKDAGAILVDPADIPTMDQISAGTNETLVLQTDFKSDIAKYLATRQDPFMHTLQDLIDFNNAHASEELKYFGQDVFIASQAQGPADSTNAAYMKALQTDIQIGGAQGIDAALAKYNVQALVAPSGTPAWKTDLVDGDHFGGASTSPAAIVGYPLINVPMGQSFGLPVGITFMGTAWSEPMLIKFAYAFEQMAQARFAPSFLAHTP